MAEYFYCEMVESEGEKLFTVVLLPDQKGSFPVILQRCPYEELTEQITDQEAVEHYACLNRHFVNAGYAVIYQHCRGTGKSTGDFIPFIHEREDGLALQQWVRQQPFYQGELYLFGGSYTSAVHLATAPFADDIKGAILAAFDQERYNIYYRNSILCNGLCGGWYTGMYKKRNRLPKSEGPDSFRMLPLSEYSKVVFSEKDPVFDTILEHPDKNDPFWNSRWGGSDTRHALNHAGIPILMPVGFFDVFFRGTLAMWQEMDENTRKQSACVFMPYDHSDGSMQPIQYINGKIEEQFPGYEVQWFDSIRGKKTPPVETGKITYYSMGENCWKCDDFAPGMKQMKISLGTEDIKYVYNPYDPSHFVGGLTSGFSGTAFQNEPGCHYSIQTFYSEIFDTNRYLKGEIKAKLHVKSDCEDTCFYMRISLVKNEGDYGLRDDIHNLSEFAPDYKPGDEIEITFCFDFLAMILKKGERLRIDIASSAYPFFVPHTNKRGLYSIQTQAVVAHNTIICAKSFLTVPLLAENE